MEIDYTMVIRNCVEPKVAYHGFKYNEEKSHPQIGSYRFTRTYYGKSQYIAISRVQYYSEDLAELMAEGDDIPTASCTNSLSEESGERLWLSNKYIIALLGHEGGGIDVTRGGVGDLSHFEQLAGLSFDEAKPMMREMKKKYLWWEFQGEAELRKVLQDILKVIINSGLDWFEDQVADIRRYHEKLDARRESDKAS
jgi:hypothetical protein